MKKFLALLALLIASTLSVVAIAQDKTVEPAAALAAESAAPAVVAPAVAAPAVAAPAAVAAPVPNKGDVAWMLTATALVLLMSVPALALFYGGLVRSKNMLSVLMQVFVIFSLITVLWVIYGYSLAFTEGSAALGPYIGGFDRAFFSGSCSGSTGFLPS